MTTHKDACPCGSGKRYKHCHMAQDQKKARRGWTAAVAVVAALVVGVAAWGAIAQWRANNPDAAGRDTLGTGVNGGPNALGGTAGDVSGGASPAPQGTFGGIAPGGNGQAPIPATTASRPLSTGGSNAVQPGENPVPWQYDVARNRHYDPRPGHQHWHDGAPPGDTSGTMTTTTVGGSNPLVTVGGGGTAAGTARVTTTTQPATGGSSALAPGENPAPWEFDAARNRHYDPRDGHRHWHSGAPPPVGQRGN